MMFDMAQRDAEKRGEARGIAIGEAKTYLSLVRDGLLDIKEACRRIHMTESEFRALLAEK